MWLATRSAAYKRVTQAVADRHTDGWTDTVRREPMIEAKCGSKAAAGLFQTSLDFVLDRQYTYSAENSSLLKSFPS